MMFAYATNFYMKSGASSRSNLRFSFYFSHSFLSSHESVLDCSWLNRSNLTCFAALSSKLSTSYIVITPIVLLIRLQLRKHARF